MLNIGKRMREVLSKIREGTDGTKGVGAPDSRIETEEEWGRGYAILCDVYPDPELAEAPYFDLGAWRSDFIEMVRACFSTRKQEAVSVYWGDSIKVTVEKPKRRVHGRWLPPGTVVIKHYPQSDEVEVYRLKEEST